MYSLAQRRPLSEEEALLLSQEKWRTPRERNIENLVVYLLWWYEKTPYDSQSPMFQIRNLTLEEILPCYIPSQYKNYTDVKKLYELMQSILNRRAHVKSVVKELKNSSESISN